MEVWRLFRNGMSLRTSLAAVVLLLAPIGARGEETPSLVVATGQLGMRKEVPHALAIDVQVRSPWHWSVIRPAAGLLTSSKGGAYVYSGVAADFHLPGAFQISPGFAPGVVIASADRDLGSRIEFRSSLELSLQLESMRLGLAFSHISNARLSDHNPGVEVLTVGLAFPARR
jgi:lipid A 3-O-deacylase